MKPVSLLFATLFSYFGAVSQLQNQTLYSKTLESFKLEYNSKNYKKIYKLLDQNFQNHLTEKEFTDFIQFNLFNLYDQMHEFKFVDTAANYMHYIVVFKNGKMNLNLLCNQQGKISSMQWLPHIDFLPEPPSLKDRVLISDNPKKTDWDRKVDSIVTVYYKNNNATGLSLAILNNNQTTYYNYGVIKKGSDIIPDTNTIYEIGSITKVFTGILLADAIGSKLVKANDAVEKHLGTEFKNLSFKNRKVELIHLANHTSRIDRIPSNLTSQTNYDYTNPYANYSKDMVLNYVKNIVIDTFPGVKNEYSNLGMGLLGLILEKVQNKNYEQLIKEKICIPLKMNNTTISLNDNQKSKFATGYDFEGNETSEWNLNALVAAGGIRSNITDMARFLKANINETLPSLKLAQLSTYNDGRNNIGFAWHLFTTKYSNELVWHNGRTGGYSSFCGLIKGRNVGIAVLSNTSLPIDQVALGILKLLQD